MKKIAPQTSIKDDRGEIIDLIEDESINAVTYVSFEKNAVRGNHYHKETTQWNYVLSGKIKIVTQLQGEETKELVMARGDLIETVPNESHALLGLESSELLVLTRGPRGGKEYESDTYRLNTPLINAGK
jgi:quercetin dioxygenase-like cupin family protein